MKKYVKPQVEVIKLRVEERLANCHVPGKTEVDIATLTCDRPTLGNEASCYDMDSPCS